MGRDNMKQLREIVCQESESLDDAFIYEKCKEFYLRLITDGVKESIAKQETLKLFNEAQWLACQEILQVTTWVTRKVDDIAVSDYFSEEDVIALAKKMPRLVPTKRIRFANDGTKEIFPVKYKSYDKWGEHCLYSLYDVTKGYTDDLLVELLYDSTDTEDGKMKLLNDMIEDAHRTWEDPEREPGYIWALTKREELQHHKKTLCERRKTNEDKVKIDRNYFVNKYGKEKIENYEEYLKKLKEKKYIIEIEQNGEYSKYKLNGKKKITKTLIMKQKYLCIWHFKICEICELYNLNHETKGTPWEILVHYIFNTNGKRFEKEKIRKSKTKDTPDDILKAFREDGFPLKDDKKRET